MYLCFVSVKDDYIDTMCLQPGANLYINAFKQSEFVYFKSTLLMKEVLVILEYIICFCLKFFKL